MADTFEQFIEKIEKYWKEIDQLSVNVKEQLRSYIEMQSLELRFKDLSDGGQGDALKTKKICEEIVYCSYITLKTKDVTLSTTVKKVEQHKAKIPERLRPRAEEIEEYERRIQRELCKADTLLQKIEREVGWNNGANKTSPFIKPPLRPNNAISDAT